MSSTSHEFNADVFIYTCRLGYSVFNSTALFCFQLCVLYLNFFFVRVDCCHWVRQTIPNSLANLSSLLSIKKKLPVLGFFS